MGNEDMQLSRRRVWSLLDKAIKKYKIIYIGTHTGWGKTTAVMQWLENENKNYEYFSFLHEDFEDNLKQLKATRKSIVVLDDIYNITEMDDQGKLLNIIASKNNKYIIMGRSSKVAFLKSFEITMQMVSFDEKEFALNIEEISEVLTINEITYTPEMAQRILEVTRGWIISIWLLAQKLKAGSTFDENLINSSKYDLFDYFDFALFRHWDNEMQNFLMAVSNFDSFNEEMAIMITGKNKIINLINYILQIGGFLHFLPPDTYTLQPVMVEYLQKKQNELCSKEVISRRIQNAGLYYTLKGDLAMAIECYYKSGDTDKVAELLIENSTRHAGNAQFYDAQRYYMFLPKKTILKFPELMSGMSMLHSLFCRPEESEHWFDELVKFKETIDKSDKRYKTAREKIAYLNIALPHRGSKGMSEIIKDTAMICLSGGLKLQEVSTTGNMPSLLNGGKDFCGWLKDDKTIYNLLKIPIEVALGKCAVGLADVALGESYFEKNTDGNYTKALSKLNNGLSEAMVRGTAQTKFAAIGVMSRLFAAQGSMNTAIDMMRNFRTKVIGSEDEYLLPNIDAFLVRQQLKLNKLKDVEIWFNEQAPNELEGFYILNRYCYMTKVRCYIQRQQYLEALSLIDKLEYYYKTYSRIYGQLETKIMLAITMFRTEDDKWRTVMNETLMECETYGLVRIIADEGASVYPLLEKLKPTCSLEFYKNVFSAVKAQVRLYPDYLKPIQKTDADLSTNEIEVLKLLVRGMKNDEIANLMELSVNTIKTHLKNIYAKLQVANRSQAIKVANEMKLI